MAYFISSHCYILNHALGENFFFRSSVSPLSTNLLFFSFLVIFVCFISLTKRQSEWGRHEEGEQRVSFIVAAEHRERGWNQGPGEAWKFSLICAAHCGWMLKIDRQPTCSWLLGPLGVVSEYIPKLQSMGKGMLQMCSDWHGFVQSYMSSTFENKVFSEYSPFSLLPPFSEHTFPSCREVKWGRKKKRNTGVLRASPTQSLLQVERQLLCQSPVETCLPGVWHPRVLSTPDSRRERAVCSIWELPNSLPLKEAQKINVGGGNSCILGCPLWTHKLRATVYPSWIPNIISQTDSANCN